MAAKVRFFIACSASRMAMGEGSMIVSIVRRQKTQIQKHKTAAKDKPLQRYSWL